MPPAYHGLNNRLDSPFEIALRSPLPSHLGLMAIILIAWRVLLGI
jgi:hypothetical protein